MPIQLIENSVVAGRFRLNRMIGRGGMGSVWRATHLGLDIPCAVKFMEGEIAQSADAQARFEREAKAAAQLRSPHVVQVLDHGVCDGTPYIAMELLDGEDLGKRLQRLGRIHPRDLNVIITQVCRALTKAHAVQIVHRDLKPDNIFLVHDDDREIAKVLDFGIAKSNMTAVGGSNTKTGAMLGTPYYMSPEQAQGIKSVDYRSDLWSLGVIVYQCLTGMLPFESEALGDLLVRIIVQPLPVPSQVADVPHGFDRWWARAASRDPAGRFQSAKEFAESLQLVFGASQATDVMDRSQLKAALGRTPAPGALQNPLMLTPSGPGAPLPAMGVTPAPDLARSGNALAGTTGGPVARTFGDGAASPAALPKRGQAVAIVGGAAVVFVLVATVGVMAVRNKATATNEAPPAATPITAAATPPPQPATVPAPAPPPTPEPPPQPQAVASTPDPTPAAPASDTPRAGHSSHSSKPTPAAPAAPSPKPAAPKPAPAPKDLGF